MITVTHDDQTDPKKPKTLIDIDNGDREALNDALGKWRFNGEAAMLRFVIAVLREAHDKSVVVTGDSGKPVTFKPADQLLINDKETPTDGNTTQQQSVSK